MPPPAVPVLVLYYVVLLATLFAPKPRLRYLSVPLLAVILSVINQADGDMAHTVIAAKEVGIVLFGPYVLAVELASMMLLAGLVGAFHLARK